jgi:hypothetical protein
VDYRWKVDDLQHDRPKRRRKKKANLMRNTHENQRKEQTCERDARYNNLFWVV